MHLMHQMMNIPRTYPYSVQEEKNCEKKLVSHDDHDPVYQLKKMVTCHIQLTSQVNLLHGKNITLKHGQQIPLYEELTKNTFPR